MKLKYWMLRSLVMALVVLVVAVINDIRPINTAESSFIETIELGVMIAALVVWAMAAIGALKSQFDDRFGTVAASIGVCAVIFAGIGREVSWGRVYGLGSDPVNMLKLMSAVMVLAALALSLLLFSLALRQRAAFLLRVLTSNAAGWIVATIVLFAISMAFEDNLFGFEPHVLYEEVFETLSYACLFVSGWVVFRDNRFADLASTRPFTRQNPSNGFTTQSHR